MVFNHVNCDIEDGIETITIHRPEALNALTKQVLEELNQLIDMIDTDCVRCLIIRGSGDKAFVAGADIKEMLQFTKKEAYEFSEFGNMVFEKIHKLSIPTIAMVNGYALGGGCELALACDLRVCSRNAVFGQPETGLGIIPGFGGTQRMTRLIGEANAKQLIFTGETINAEEAFRIGLVNEVCDKVELSQRVRKMAAAISDNAPIAVRIAKRVISEGLELSLCDGLKLEAEQFSRTFLTDDQKEGMTAFLEKRAHGSFKNQ